MAEQTMVERVAKAIEIVMGIYGSPTLCRKAARAAIEALTVDDLEALLREHLSAP